MFFCISIVRSALKFAANMQKQSSWNIESGHCLEIFLNVRILFSILLCISVFFKELIFSISWFLIFFCILSPLRDVDYFEEMINRGLMFIMICMEMKNDQL